MSNTWQGKSLTLWCNNEWEDARLASSVQHQSWDWGKQPLRLRLLPFWLTWKRVIWDGINKRSAWIAENVTSTYTKKKVVSRFIQCSYNNLYIWKWILNFFFPKLRLLQAKVSKRHAKLVKKIFTFRSRQSRYHLIKEIKIITLRTIEGARGGEWGRTSLLLSFSSLHFVCYSLCLIRLNGIVKSRIIVTLLLVPEKYGKIRNKILVYLLLYWLFFFFLINFYIDFVI